MATEEERIQESARRIRRSRKNMTLTQNELAQALGVTPNAVGGWETGRHEPNPHSLRALSELLGREAAYLRASDLEEEGVNGSRGADPGSFNS